MLQESVFISPYDITQDFTEFIDAQGLSESAYLLEVSSIAVGDIKALVNKVWNLDEIDEMYGGIIEEVKKNDLIFDRDCLKKLNENGNEKVQNLIIKIKKAYLEIVLKDPFLPKELLPPDWLGYEAKRIIKNL